MHADLARDRKQQRAEQHHRRNALEHAAEHDERDYGDCEEAPGTTGDGGRVHEPGIEPADIEATPASAALKQLVPP